MLENIWSKSIRVEYIDGRKKKVIIDIDGNVVNSNPTEEDLKGFHNYLTTTSEILRLQDEEKSEYLLEFLRYFNEKEGRPPTERDFDNNSKYPSRSTYWKVFGGWNKAIEMAGLVKIKKYKINVSFDGINFFWIVIDENGKIIRNPTEKDLKGATDKSYNPTNFCPRCREEYERGDISELTDKGILRPGNARRVTDKVGNKTDEWVCSIHGLRYYNHSPDGILTLQKSLRDRRLGIQDPESPNAKGDKGELLTEKVFGIKRLSIENDHYNGPLDHPPILNSIIINIGGKLVDLSEKIPQTKIAYYSRDVGTSGGWYFKYRTTEYNKPYDIMILWCVSEDGLNIERGYIIPKLEIKKRTSVAIVKNPSKGVQWYIPYRIEDKVLIDKKANNSWKEIINEE